MRNFKSFKIVDSEFIVKHNFKLMDNVKVGDILMTFLLTNYGIRFEMGLSFIFSDRFNFYIGGSDDFYGYIKLNKIWLCYIVYKSYILKANRIVKMLLN